MKQFFDTSVLVAAILSLHEHHEASFSLVSGSRREDSCCTTHALAESYCTLTRISFALHVEPEEASLALSKLRQKTTILQIDEMDYWETIGALSASNISGAREGVKPFV